MSLFAVVTFMSSMVLSNAVALKAISIANIPEADVVVNADKGFVLERVGTYSRKIDEGIIHTVVPLRGLCASLSPTEVCVRASQLTKQNSIELDTVRSVHGKDWPVSLFEKKDISTLIGQHINNMLSNYRPDEFLSNVTSNFHFFDSKFYVVTRNDSLVDEASKDSDQTNQEITSYDAKNAPVIIWEQLRSHTIGFNFLTDEEINVILLPLMSSIDKSYINADVEELMTDFSRLIVSQTVNAFRSCAISQNNQLYSACLIISTLFVRPLPSAADTYTVYHLHLLPVNANGYRYVYSNLPKTFGFNAIDQSVIVWDDEPKGSKCILSKIVQCSKEPMPISLLNTPCLSELLNTGSIQTNACEIARTPNAGPEIFNVAHDIWVFNNLEGIQYCKPQSYQSKSNDIVIMNESTTVQLPCGTDVKCFDIQIPWSKRSNGTVLVDSIRTETYEKQMNLRIPLKQLTTKLISAYKTKLRGVLDEIQQDVDENMPVMKRIMQKFANLIHYLVLLLILTILMTVGKYIKMKQQKQLNRVERQVNKISDIFLNGDNSV